jgi:hypothetical protein
MRLEGGAKSDFRLRKSLWCLNEPLDLARTSQVEYSLDDPRGWDEQEHRTAHLAP